jgi:hypothetical protein
MSNKIVDTFIEWIEPKVKNKEIIFIENFATSIYGINEIYGPKDKTLIDLIKLIDDKKYYLSDIRKKILDGENHNLILETNNEYKLVTEHLISLRQTGVFGTPEANIGCGEILLILTIPEFFKSKKGDIVDKISGKELELKGENFQLKFGNIGKGENFEKILNKVMLKYNIPKEIKNNKELNHQFWHPNHSEYYNKQFKKIGRFETKKLFNEIIIPLYSGKPKEEDVDYCVNDDGSFSFKRFLEKIFFIYGNFNNCKNFRIIQNDGNIYCFDDINLMSNKLVCCGDYVFGKSRSQRDAALYFNPCGSDQFLGEKNKNRRKFAEKIYGYPAWKINK